MADEPAKPFLEVDILNLGMKSFGSLKELKHWVHVEISTWQKITEQIRAAGDEGKKAIGFCDQIVDRLQKLESNIDANVEGSSLRNPQEVVKAISAAFAESCIPTELPEVQMIVHAMKDYNRSVAAGLAEYVIENFRGGTQNLWRYGHGITLGLLEKEGIRKRGDYAPIKRLHEEWQNTHASNEEKFRTWFDAKVAETNLLEERFKQVLLAKEPAEYWNSKRSRHFWSAVLFAVLFLIAAGVGGGLMINWFVSSHDEVVQMLNQLAAGSGEPFAVRAIALLPLTLAKLVAVVGLFWILRIIARVLLTQIHLHADASERVVMVKTYLALLLGKGVLDGKPGVDKEDLTLILSQLFRPSGTGIFGDDASPQVPLLLAEMTRLDASLRSK